MSRITPRRRLLLLAAPVVIVACTREVTAPVPRRLHDQSVLEAGGDSARKDTAKFGGGSAGGGGAGRPY